MHRARPWLVVLTITLAVAFASAGPASAQARQPNILMIVGDDMGYADIGVHGSKDIPTPNIDALARERHPLHRCLRDRAVLLPDARRLAHRPLSAAVRARVQPGPGRRTERRAAAGRDDDRRPPEGGGLPHGARRQMASRIGRSISIRCRAASTSSSASSAATTPTSSRRRTRTNPLFEGRSSRRSERISDRRAHRRAVAFIRREKRGRSSSIWPSTPSTRRCRRPRSTWRGSRTSPTSSAAPMPP